MKKNALATGLNMANQVLWRAAPNVAQKAGLPTPAAGKLTAKKRKQLKSEAPETLVAPKRFTSERGYKNAKGKFKSFGNWASDT